MTGPYAVDPLHPTDAGSTATGLDVVAQAFRNASIFLVDAPTAPVSSTAVRQRCAAGESIHGWVPPAVEEYIKTHGLYVASR